MVEMPDEEAAAYEAAAMEEAECEVEEMIAMDEEDGYLEIVIQLLAIVHSLTSLSMLIAYYCLKVWVIIAHRESRKAHNWKNLGSNPGHCGLPL